MNEKEYKEVKEPTEPEDDIFDFNIQIESKITVIEVEEFEIIKGIILRI